jgi:hypothetical protein
MVKRSKLYGAVPGYQMIQPYEINVLEAGLAKMTEKLPFNYNYEMFLSTFFVNCDQCETINPSQDSSYSEQEWNFMSRYDQEKWPDSEAREWAMGLIEFGWRKP